MAYLLKIFEPAMTYCSSLFYISESLGEVTFDPAPDSYTVREGTAIPAILCNSECVPACKFEWFKDGRFLYESDGINFGEVGAVRCGYRTYILINLEL